MAQEISELEAAADSTVLESECGSVLVVVPHTPADTLSRYVFETDGARVTRYRTGLFPAVEYVEGCG